MQNSSWIKPRKERRESQEEKDCPSPQEHSWWKGSGMLQTTSTERRAAGGDRGGDRPRSDGSVNVRPR